MSEDIGGMAFGGVEAKDADTGPISSMFGQFKDDIKPSAD